MTVRRARARDRERLAEFNRAMAWETERRRLPGSIVRRGVGHLLRHPGHGFYVVAENRGRIVGSLMITYEWSDWRDGVFWWIQSVYVVPAQRRQAVYRRLYEHVKALAARRGGVCGFRLYVAAWNRAAQAAYRRCGMQATHYQVFEEAIARRHPSRERLRTSSAQRPRRNRLDTRGEVTDGRGNRSRGPGSAHR